MLTGNTLALTNKLKEVNTAMTDELTRRGIEYRFPCIEIYGPCRRMRVSWRRKYFWGIEWPHFIRQQL